MQTDRQVAILVAILVIIHQKISTFDFGKGFDERNPYMKFGSNRVIKC